MFKLFVLATIVALSSASIMRRQLSSHVCDVICDEEMEHASQALCGTNGVLYKNKCEYNNAHCMAQQNGDLLGVASYGACVDDQTPCDVALHSTCVNYHISTTHTTGGLVMPIDHSMPVGNVLAAEKVCGSDQNTYQSLCVFRQAQCKIAAMTSTKEPLSLDHMGECKLDTSNATQIDCAQYLQTIPDGIAIETGSSIHPHLNCPRTYHPVCSTDGRTYTNECLLCQFSIMKGTITTTDPTLLAFDGMCHHSGVIFG